MKYGTSGQLVRPEMASVQCEAGSLGQSQLRLLLQTAVDRCLQERPLDATQQQLLLSATERIAQQLEHLISDRAGGPVLARTQVTPSYLLQSPVYRPLSPAPADLEIQDLEEQVNAAAQRAALLRQSVPARLKEIYADKLAQLRPSLDGLGAEAPAPAAGGEGEAGRENAGAGRDAPPTYSPDPQLLQGKLAEAGARLPMLRARLEEASDRVQRVFAVLATELNRPPPDTVERAVLGKTPGRPGDRAQEAGGGAACEQALESGMVSSRRRLGDVQPVPLDLEEADAA